MALDHCTMIGQMYQILQNISSYLKRYESTKSSDVTLELTMEETVDDLLQSIKESIAEGTLTMVSKFKTSKYNVPPIQYIDEPLCTDVIYFSIEERSLLPAKARLLNELQILLVNLMAKKSTNSYTYSQNS